MRILLIFFFLFLKHPVYGGDLILNNSNTNLQGEYSFDTLSLVGASTLFIKPYKTGYQGVLVLRVQQIFISSNSAVVGTARGGGGAGMGGGGDPNQATVTPDTWKIGGGGGGYGGVGGNGGNNTNSGGVSFGSVSDQESISMGSRGGVASAYRNDQYGAPGYGGALLKIFCDKITIDGTIVCNGGQGGDGTTFGFPYPSTSGGGGGSGGGILISANEIGGSIHGQLSSRGGNGGQGILEPGNFGGGGGGGGRIIIIYMTNYFSGSVSVSNGTGGAGDPAKGITNNGRNGLSGSAFMKALPAKPVIETPVSGSMTETDRPVLKMKSRDMDSSQLKFIVELSENNFISIKYLYETSYAPAVTWVSWAVPERLEIGKKYYCRVSASDGELVSQATNLTFTCGIASEADVEPGASVKKHQILSLNGDGRNDYLVFNLSSRTADFIIKIFKVSGELVKTLPVNSSMWDGKDDMGSYVESGTYLFQVKAGDKISTGLITVIK